MTVFYREDLKSEAKLTPEVINLFRGNLYQVSANTESARLVNVSEIVNYLYVGVYGNSVHRALNDWVLEFQKIRNFSHSEERAELCTVIQTLKFDNSRRQKLTEIKDKNRFFNLLAYICLNPDTDTEKSLAATVSGAITHFLRAKKSGKRIH